MTRTPEQAYDELRAYARETALLSSIEQLLGWDEQVLLPPQGTAYRADQISLLARMVHDRWTDARMGDWLGELVESPLAADPGSTKGTMIRELKRRYDKKVKLPPTLVEELARTAVHGQHAWKDARRSNDFAAFRPHLEKTFELKRQEADALGWRECRYDALLDDYEPHAKTSEVAGVLARLREALVPLVGEITGSGRRPDTSFFRREFPFDKQLEFGRKVVSELGFDFQRGRLDTTAHPFCSGLGPNDCRLTTRITPSGFRDTFFSILHEGGHGIYDQGLPAEEYGLPPGEPISLGIHESQSRMWENLVGRSRSFWERYFDDLRATFPPALDGVSLDAWYAAVNDVHPSLIRTEADEATYNLHILIRFELEQALLDGDLPVADLPATWNAKYRDYLGIESPTDADGVLQDIHWSAGLIGYFATYSLGNLYASQFFQQAAKDLGDLDEQFRRGAFQPLREWLNKHIHQVGQRFTAAQLIERVTGKPLSHEALMTHLRGKFIPLYGLN